MVLIILAIVLAVIWIVAFALVKISSAAIHILLILALVSLIAHLFRHGRKST